MVSPIFSSLAHSSLSCLSDPPNRTPFLKQNQLILLSGQKLSLPSFGRNSRLSLIAKRRQAPVCFFNGGKDSKSSLDGPGSGLDWPILKRWDVPWQWQTVSLTSLACGLSFVLTGVVEVAALPYLGLKIEELSLDEKGEILFLDQGITTAVVIGVLFGIINTLDRFLKMCFAMVEATYSEIILKSNNNQQLQMIYKTKLIQILQLLQYQVYQKNTIFSSNGSIQSCEVEGFGT